MDANQCPRAALPEVLILEGLTNLVEEEVEEEEEGEVEEEEVEEVQKKAKFC